MHFSWLDLLILICAFGFVWGGFWSGLIQSLGGVVGLFLGQIIASRYYEQFAGVIAPVFGGNAITSKIFAFILLFLFVTRLTGILFFFINKIFKFFAIVPGLHLVNKLGGAAFGLIEASLFIGITLQFIVRLPISEAFARTLHDSQVANYFLGLSGWLIPLFPKVLKQAEDATKSVLPANINVNASDAGKAINAAKTIQDSGILNANLPR